MKEHVPKASVTKLIYSFSSDQKKIALEIAAKLIAMNRPKVASCNTVYAYYFVAYFDQIIFYSREKYIFFTL